MRRTVFSCVGVMLACLALAPGVAAQQGGGGQRGGGAGRGNVQQERYDRSARSIDTALGAYLDGESIRNILTPGEYSEWTLTLREGQVVIAEASSDAFDPAIEITAEEKTLASSDDRYPGDQRPLLLWKSALPGTYALRVRSFRDRAGGPFFVRFRVYDSMDLSDGLVETDSPKADRFLIHLPMKAGQMKRVVVENPRDADYVNVSLGQVISPTGLPDIALANALRQVLPNTILAPIDGDYFVVASGAPRRGQQKVRLVARDVPALKPAVAGLPAARIPTNAPALWAINVKAGETIEASAPELDAQAVFIIAEQPELPVFDPNRPETNPFFPQLLNATADKPQAFSILPGRARDNRVLALAAKRDAALWIASNASAKANAEFTFNIRPAAQPFAERTTSKGKLTIGRTDYWTFNGDAGDVMSFRSNAAGFAQRIVVRDPDFNEIWSSEAELDRNEIDWSFVVRKPGRYLVAVSCVGEGGSGEYTLAREVFLPKEFSKATPAEGALAEGAVHVWKFTAKPEEPLLVRWTSSDWSYSIGVQDDRGAPAALALEMVDRANQFGILAVDKPVTYLIVLTANGRPARYSIGLSDLPVGRVR